VKHHTSNVELRRDHVITSPVFTMAFSLACVLQQEANTRKKQKPHFCLQ